MTLTFPAGNLSPRETLSLYLIRNRGPGGSALSGTANVALQILN